MESEGDETSHLHPKQSKPTNPAQISSTSMQESSFEIPVLPAELITEILLRLPVKSLLKFRCVSKSWFGFISSPEFVKTHLSISVNDEDNTHHRLILGFKRPEYNLKECSLSSLLYGCVTEAFDLDYPMKNNHESVRVMGSVNGFICLAIDEKDFFMWNPSIRKFKKLPDSRATLSTVSYFMYGFGYDELHDDYKVVGAFRIFYNSSYHLEVKIYSLNTDSWRSIDDFHSGVLFIRTGMFVNGKLHWANNTSQNLQLYNGWDIISIDLADGKWGKVEKPCYGEGVFEFTLCLGVLGSDLSVFCHKRETHADVWVMKEYGVKESWTKMFIINVEYQFCPPFCMSNKGEILFAFGSTFGVYYPKDNLIRYPEVTNCHAFVVANMYNESLVWPFSTKGTEDATAMKTETLK